MRKTSLIATALTLALAGAAVVTVATAYAVPDPIAHAAGPDRRLCRSLGHHRPPAATRTPIRSAGALAPVIPRHAFGKACASESRKHVKGHPGTPFSECVHALKR